MVEQPSRFALWRKRALNLLLFVVLIAGIRAWQHRNMASGSAPPLHGTLLNGAPYTLSSRPSEPVLVHFWATWCPVCRTEQASIAAIAHDDTNVITVAMQSEGREKIGAYLAQQGLHFPVLNDPEGRLASAWGVHAVPASFVVDSNGQVRFIEVGYTTEIGLRLRLWLARIL